MEPGGSSWRHKLQSIFGLDLRSLALFRIALGMILLIDIVIRYQDVHAFYTDEGALPRAGLPVFNSGMSVHELDGSLPFQVVLFYLHGFAALALILGWFTRYVHPLAWFLTMSIHCRNPMVLHGGDVLLRQLLFWSMFLPVSACYSLDSLARAAPDRRRVVSMGSVALILQMCIVYWFAGLLKWGEAWRDQGYALYMALSVGHFTTSLGNSLLEYHGLLRFLSYATICLEWFGPFLLFVPWYNWLFRLLAIASFMAFHLCIGLTMSMGIFQPVCVIAWLVFLPGEFWNWLDCRLRRTRPQGLKLVFDPADPGCRQSARFWTTFLMVTDLETVSAVDPVRERGEWALIEKNEKRYRGFDTIRLLLRLSPLFWPLSYLPGLRNTQPVRESLFRGDGDSASAPPASPALDAGLPPAIVPLSGRVNVVLALLILYVFAWNIRTWDEPRAPDDPIILDGLLECRDVVRNHFPPQFASLGYAIGLDQGWGLFAPQPGKQHGWIVAVGTLENGRKVDLLRDGEPVNWERPASISNTYRNSRWRQYLMYLSWISLPDYSFRHYYGLYLERMWADEHPDPQEQLRYVELFSMVEITQPDYKPLLLEKWRLSKLDCKTMLSDLKPVKDPP
jgi:hypothetical protein